MSLNKTQEQTKAKILLVDDDAETRQVIKGFLESQGYEVDIASCADEAIGKLKTTKPDLVFSDIRMPGMDGLSLLRHIKEQDPLTEVVIITGFASVHTAIDAMRKGADDFVMKPIDLGHLSLIVQRSIKKKNLSLEIKRKQDEIKELEELNRRLEEVNRLKDDFIATISHELSTPVTFINESLEILRDPKVGVSDEKKKSLFVDLVKHCRHLKRFISNLLDLSVIREGILEKNPSDIRDIIEDALAEASHYHGAEKVALSFKKPDCEAIINVDRNRLQEAFYHLFANAIKFNRQGGQVNVYLDKTQEQVIIRVEDTGIGIDEAQKDRIFEKFYQVDQGLTREHGGAGVGLALVKKYVELHGGSINVGSRPSQGSVFTIMLPNNKT